VILSVWSRESPVVSALEPTTGRIVTSSFDWTGLLPGFRYKVEVYPYFKIAGAYSVNPWSVDDKHVPIYEAFKRCIKEERMTSFCTSS
jgi:hypothetical protein